MTYKQFLLQIKKGKIHPFYLFEGEENYLKKRALHKLRKKILPSQNQNFNFQPLNATQHTGQQILEAAYQLPFNSRWQLVIVEEAENLSLKDKEKILDYLKNPLDTTCIVFVGEKFDTGEKFYRFFKQKNKVVSFNPLSEKEAAVWIRRKIEKEGKTITDEAIFQLYERTGGDVSLIQNEIDKLISFTHPKTSIQESDILKLSGEVTQKNIFDFIQAFRQKDLSSTLHILHTLILTGKEPLAIHAMLAREIRILLKLKLAGSKIDPYQACRYIFKSQTNYTRFFLDKAKQYLEATERFTLEHLLFAHQKILSTEFAIKKGKEEAVAGVEREILDILTYDR